MTVNNVNDFTRAIVSVVKAAASNSFAPSSYPETYALALVVQERHTILPAEQLNILEEGHDETSSIELEAIVRTWVKGTYQSERDLMCNLADAWCVLNNIALPDDRR